MVLTEDEIMQYLSDKLPDGSEGPSKWPGMTYEQGVEAALNWVAGYTNERPLDD